MKETKIRAAPKLQFSEEELETEGLKKPILQVEKAAEKRKADAAEKIKAKKEAAEKAESSEEYENIIDKEETADENK